MDFEVIFMLFITFVLSITIITMLAACVCCRKSVPKNELMGLEGMVKLKNPDHNSTNDIIAVSNDPKPSDAEAKRSSNAPHRSLPDIPVSEPPGDTSSDLYATVGDKVAEKPQGRSPSTSIKKLASVSQHSSLSQADDVSSPYARVRSPPHAYDKVRPAEHPYAQVKAGPSSSDNLQPFSSSNDISNLNRRDSDHEEDGELPRNSSQIHIVSAASAIAGRISASQELPYMTLPIVPPQQHFSGDSQDSSKGYTSISVREPLANIIAQTNQQNSHTRRRELIDSHYATVSDDSDEMYAAIEDPNNQGDLYTSGSETYAQIQPPISLTVAAEINTIPSTSKVVEDISKSDKSPPIDQSPQRHSIISTHHDESHHLPPPVENLRSVHSRQASSSSSVGNLGSPKPEKRQANSPLPPTPKSTHYLSNSNLTNTSSIPSGRNSAASVIEVQPIGSTSRQVSRENLTVDSKKHSDDFVRKKGHIEDLYAKVMKKNKLSNAPSQNTSPVPYRKSFQDISRPNLFLSDPDINLDEDALSSRSIVHIPSDRNSTAFAGTTFDNDYETIDKRRNRSSNYDDGKDHGYETIPATVNITSIDDGVETQNRAGLIEEIPQDFIPQNDELRKVQKNWDLPRIISKFDGMLDSSEPVTRARLLASSTKESSKWLQVVPSSQLGLLLDNNAARIAVGLRLGSQLCEEHKCICGSTVKKDGLHGLSCQKRIWMISRHDEVNKVFSHAISSAGFPNILQPPGISRDDGKRPDGMTLIPWSHGKSLLCDVTIRDTLAPSYVNESSKKARSIADKAERLKHNHYIRLKENHLFTPIAFESLGCMGPETKTFIEKLGSLIRAATGESRSKDYLLQKISIAIQRGNSACILGTMGKNRVDDFYLL